MNKKSFVKRILAVALSLIMVLGLMPMTVFADGTYTFTPTTQSGNNTSTIQYSMTDENAGDFTLTQNSQRIELVLMLDEGWYFEKWDTYFDGYEDVAILTDPQIEGVNPKPDNGSYTFFNQGGDDPIYDEEGPSNNSYYSGTRVENWAKDIYVTIHTPYYGRHTITAVLKPILTVIADDGIDYQITTNSPSYRYLEKNQVAVKYGDNATGTYSVDNKYVVTSVSANYMTSYSENGTVVTVNSIKKPATVTIQTRLKQHNIVFDANGGEGTMAQQSYSYGEAQALTANSFTRSDYTFAGWNTKADGTGTAYTDKQSITFTPANDGDSITLYAQWERSNYTVSFNANGGTNTMDAVKVDRNSEYTLPVNGFTAPSAYQFKGWATSADGDVISTETITVTADTTLYAIWEKIPAEAPVVQISGNLELIYGEFTNQKITVTVEKKEGYTYSYYWAESFGEMVATTDTFHIPDNMSAGAHFYDCAVIATREDNGESSSTIIRDIYVGIKPKEIDNNGADVTLSKTEFTYNGEDQKPDVAITYKGKPLTEGTDYTISWPADCKNAGLKTITVNFMGNYSGSVQKTFTIEKATPVIGTVSVDGVVNDTTKPYDVVLTRTDLTIDGKLELDMADDDAMLANKSAYNWVFTPTDTANYNVIKGSVQIDVLDTVVPNGTIKVDTNEWKQIINNITFGLFFKETQEVTITAADNENGSGIKDILYFVSDKELSDDDLAAAEWKSYTEAFDIEPDCKFVVYAKITDNDGNAVIINSDGVVVDETAAVVSGITDGETYYGQLVFTVADELAGVKSVVIDGNDETHFEGQYVINGDNAEHTVVVTDNAGNVTEYKVTVYKNYTVTYVADGETVAEITVGHGENAAFPKVPAKDGYVGKWDRNNENITSDTVINAVYTEIPVVKPDEVKPEDKADLEDTKKQLEDMLDDDSYTEDDKKDIQDAIDNIDDALEVIGNVENVEELIDKLPDTIKKDDEPAIKAADDAYNALTDYEKSLVDEDAKKALDDAKAALAELNKPADTTSPNTGDNSNIWLWVALLFISGGATVTLTVYDRKKRAAQK